MNANLFAILLSLSVVSSASIATVSQSTPTKPQNEVATTAGKINLNKASVEKLTHSFKNIGSVRAHNIVSYRENHGDFKSISELSAVKGFSEAFIQKNIIELQKVFSVK